MSFTIPLICGLEAQFSCMAKSNATAGTEDLVPLRRTPTISRRYTAVCGPVQCSYRLDPSLSRQRQKFGAESEGQETLSPLA